LLVNCVNAKAATPNPNGQRPANDEVKNCYELVRSKNG